MFSQPKGVGEIAEVGLLTGVVGDGSGIYVEGVGVAIEAVGDVFGLAPQATTVMMSRIRITAVILYNIFSSLNKNPMLKLLLFMTRTTHLQ